MSRLRGKRGCPWDRKQTHKSLTPYLVEEAYELIEAIRSGKDKEIEEELGDVLLQVIFHAQIAKDRGAFNIDKVMKGINDKLVARHPHVFGGKKGIKTPAHVRTIWEANKKAAKKRESVIDGVPRTMPALLRSRRLVSKAGSAGFKWGKNESVLAKVMEEVAEVRHALKSGNKKHVKEEIGDLLFALSALAYYNNINAEESLNSANEKFVKRFKRVEKNLKKGMKEKEILELWERAKKV